MAVLASVSFAYIWLPLSCISSVASSVRLVQTMR